MTAMNIIVQAKAGTAYLLTDTAAYTPDGVVRTFHPKVLTLAIGSKSFAAIATTGMSAQPAWRCRLADQRAESVEDVLRALPEAFRDVECELKASGAAEDCGTGHMSAVVAVFDGERREASGYAISNDTFLFPPGKAVPYRLQPVLKYLTRYRGQPFPRGTDMCDPRRWDPRRDAAALIQAQRADEFGLEGGTFVGVGGRAILTTVSAAGVEHQVVTAWGDCAGRQIDRSLDQRSSFLGRLRQQWRMTMQPRMPTLTLEQSYPD